MWSIRIYKAFYVFLHCTFTIFEYVYGALGYVNNKIVDLCHEFLLITEKNKYLRKQLHKITKRPTHLTLLLGAEEPSYKDLANLIIWCIVAQISFISFYDYKGILKKNEHELQYEVDRRKSKDDYIIWHNGSDSTYKNGFIGRKIHVKIMTEEDGRHNLVNLTKNFLLNKDRDFSVENISESLHKRYEFPEPDLGFVCGKIFRLYNYPPWQVRVTEFLRIKSVRNITFSSFVEHLVRYSQCEKRLGK